MRGAGDTLATMILTVIALWVIRVPVSIALDRAMGTTGIWLSILISALASTLLHWAYYLTGRWKRKVVVQPNPAGPQPASGD